MRNNFSPLSIIVIKTPTKWHSMALTTARGVKFRADMKSTRFATLIRDHALIYSRYPDTL
jgi:hypothetical protein